METQIESQTGGQAAAHHRYSATYSPDDNKLRLYSSARLSKDLYSRVREAGFRWAPKQELFVAPMWTPERADILLELCGDIGDEDTSLVQRAETRADRFDSYSERRADEAVSARDAVAAIADVMNGQPILVGHHSADRARRDAQKIENGMRKAIRLWDTSSYWTQRAQGALKHANYKLRSDVRARRIKRIEADRRKQVRTADQSARFLKVWQQLHLPESLRSKDGHGTTFRERAVFIAGRDPGIGYGIYGDLESNKITPEEGQAKAIERHERVVAYAGRWIAHYDNRLAYERAMLEDAGGTVAERSKPEKDGACQCWASPRGGWSYIVRVNRVTVSVLDNWGNGGPNFARTIQFDKLSRVMSSREVEEARRNGWLIETEDKTGFFLRPSGTTGAKENSQPVAAGALSDSQAAQANNPDAAFEVMREQLANGIEVVSADQLFPTPEPLAARMMICADLHVGHRILEPSGGTGRLLRAIVSSVSPDSTTICAVEINAKLAESLRASFVGVSVECRDFLSFDNDKFDRIIMNPPFKDEQDIAHVQHALGLLAPGGRLVAIVSTGFKFHVSRRAAAFRQQLEALRVRTDDLGDEVFAVSGTRVGTVLLTIDLPQ